QDHGGIAVAPAVVLGRLDQPLHLPLGQVLAGSVFRIGFAANCAMKPRDANDILRSEGKDALRRVLDDESRAANTTQQRQILPSPSEPMAVAREFVKDQCLFGQHLTLRYWRAGWWTWNTAHWVEVDEQTVRSLLYTYTEDAICLSSKGMPEPWSPTKGKISN